MKYLTFIRHSESYRAVPAAPCVDGGDGQVRAELAARTAPSSTPAACLPSKEGAPHPARRRQAHRDRRPVLREQGGHRRLGHPARRTRRPKRSAIATEFMELHRKHWPGFEGESEVRPMFDPGMGPER